MNVDRRGFLKIAGLVSAGAAAAPVFNMLTQGGTSDVLATDGSMAGKRWGMVVDPEKCVEGCTDCINACHSTHNVPDIKDPNHTVKWIWQASFKQAFPDQEDHFIEERMHGVPHMLLCNHCANPACVRACPTGATFKREDGIVVIDFHRCIGCRYCMVACPYGARSFNWKDPRPELDKTNPNFPTRTKGVVEKCNFCAERLADGLLPACVESCKTGALTFGNLEDEESEVRKLLETRFALQRKPGAGTEPKIYYLV